MEKRKIRREQISLSSACREVMLGGMIWHPDGPARAVLVVVHGMQEHIGRYRPMAEALNRAGFLVCAYNQLGHGNSLVRGTRGILPGREGARWVVADCRRFVAAIRREHPELPCFLMGHSFGSFVVRQALTDPKTSQGLKGCILSGTAGADWGMRLVALPATRILAALLGEDHQSCRFDRLANTLFARKFPGESSPHRWVSSLPEEVARFDSDPQMQFVLSLGGYRTVLEVLEQVSRSDWAKKIDPALPFLLLSGEADPVGGEGSGVRQVAERLSRAGCRDLTLRLEPGFRHELLHEPCRKQVILLIRQWMEQRL